MNDHHIDNAVRIALAVAAESIPKIDPGVSIGPDDIESATMFAAAKCLAEFDPSQSPIGDEGFGPYCVRRCRWAVSHEFDGKRTLLSGRPHRRGVRVRVHSLDAPRSTGRSWHEITAVGCPVRDLEDRLDDADEYRRLLCAVGELPDEQREAASRCLVGGETARSVAADWGVSPSFVDRRVQSSRAALRVVLTPDEPPTEPPGPPQARFPCWGIATSMGV